MKSQLVYLMLLLLPIISYAKIDSNLADIKLLIQKQYPEATFLTQTECDIGSTKIKSIGLLIKQGAAHGNKHPLTPLVVYKVKDQWELFEIPKSLNYSKGSSADFLYDFWNPKTNSLVRKYNIRCTDPNDDNDISTNSSGEFTKNFLSKKSAKHICFEADTTYNSWACFSFNPDSKKIEASFSQMNAD